MNKLRRPTLATTENCIKLLKEVEAIIRRSENNAGHPLVKMVLTMLTNDQRWLDE
tara:strand:- start:62 stop:226 length:165 start_codon:yes stop_codon:yes gene_type:complete